MKLAILATFLLITAVSALPVAEVKGGEKQQVGKVEGEGAVGVPSPPGQADGEEQKAGGDIQKIETDKRPEDGLNTNSENKQSENDLKADSEKKQPENDLNADSEKKQSEDDLKTDATFWGGWGGYRSYGYGGWDGYYNPYYSTYYRSYPTYYYNNYYW